MFWVPDESATITRIAATNRYMSGRLFSGWSFTGKLEDEVASAGQLSVGYHATTV